MSCASTDNPVLRRLLPLIVVLGLGGCAAPGPAPEVATQVDAAAQRRYEQALGALADDDHVQAEALLTALIRDYPDLDGPRLNLAILYADTDRAEEAMTVLRSVVERDPQDAVAWSQMGILHRRAGDFPAADDAYLKALAVSPDYSLAHRNRGVLLDLYLGRPDEALVHYERYLQLEGSDAEVEKWVAELELRLGRPASSRVAER